MSASDTVISELHNALQSQRDRNDLLRIECDHLRAEVVNITADNGSLLARIRELEAKESVRVALESQGFTL